MKPFYNYFFERLKSPDVIYSRLESSEESAILETVRDAVDYYAED